MEDNLRHLVVKKTAVLAIVEKTRGIFHFFQTMKNLHDTVYNNLKDTCSKEKSFYQSLQDLTSKLTDLSSSIEKKNFDVNGPGSAIQPSGGSSNEIAQIDHKRLNTKTDKLRNLIDREIKNYHNSFSQIAEKYPGRLSIPETPSSHSLYTVESVTVTSDSYKHCVEEKHTTHRRYTQKDESTNIEVNWKPQGVSVPGDKGGFGATFGEQSHEKDMQEDIMIHRKPDESCIRATNA